MLNGTYRVEGIPTVEIARLYAEVSIAARANDKTIGQVLNAIGVVSDLREVLTS